MGVSWFGWGAVSSSRPADARAARTAAVKDGRRPPPQAARSVLDGGEHDATLKAAPAKNQPRALSRLTPKGERSLNREPTVPPTPTYFTPTWPAAPRHRTPRATPGRRTLRPPLRHRRITKPTPSAAPRAPRETAVPVRAPHGGSCRPPQPPRPTPPRCRDTPPSASVPPNTQERPPCP